MGRQLGNIAEPLTKIDTEQVESFLPSPIRFKGQPQPRFWEMEETQTDFGKIETSATGLLHLMLAEFGLIYANDWFMLPHPVESIIPSQTGQGMSGYEAAWPNETEEPPVATDETVKIRYALGATVPKNWIPFIPVHAEGNLSEIRLQRARMVNGEPPLGWILSEPRSPYFVEEEEVPRSGVYVERSWQRVRWIGGKTFVWVGRRKTAGRGEGWGKLVFDQIVDLPVKKTD